MKTPSWFDVVEKQLESIELFLETVDGWNFPQKRLVSTQEDVLKALNDYCPGSGKVKIRFLGANDYNLYTLNGGSYELKALFEAEKPKPKQYRIHSFSFKHDVNGNPISCYRIFELKTDSEGHSCPIQIQYMDRRSQCGYVDHRCEHAIRWLQNYTGKRFKFISKTGDRSTDLIEAIFEEVA